MKRVPRERSPCTASPLPIPLLRRFLRFFAGIITPDKNGPCLRESTVCEGTDGERTARGVNGGTALCLRCEKRRESPEDVGGLVVSEQSHR